MANAIRLYGGTSIDRAKAIESVPAAVQAKGVMDTIYPWWFDEREFPRRAVITEWFYNPLKGQPRYVDIYRLRALAASEWVWMCTSTIIEELAQIPWEVEPKDPKLKEDPPERLLAIIDEIKYFLNNPNDNKGETLNTIFRAALRDGLEIDATCMIKGFTANSYAHHPAGGFELKPPGERQLVELFARDGGSFLKETDVNGIEYRYWQYSYLHPAVAPIEFDTNEIVYAARYPRSYSVYGWGELQSMETVLNCLINSAFTNATMFQEWAVPSGVLSFSGTKEDEDRMREYWRTEVKGRFHKVAMLNRDAKFVPLAYTNRDLEFLEGQRWFAQLVWALYKLTPTELGFQDEIRQTGKAMNAQGQIQKRKSVMPLLHLVEQFMTQQIISEFSDELQFVFNFVDKQEELAETEIALEKIKEGLITTNEWRKKSKSGDPREWGDEPMQIILARMKAAAEPPGVGSNPTGPGQAALSDMTAEQHGLMEGAKAWGGRPFQSFDFEDRADRASPVYSYDQTGKIVQQADTTLHPEAYGKDFVPSRRGPYAGRAKPIPYPMGAMGQRPDEPGPRDGMMLGGENPEEINKTRQQMAEEHARSSGQGSHRWERDETNAGIAMGKIIDPLDRLAPPRRVTDPITDPESKIVPTPLVRPDDQHPKGKRDVPPVAGATGPKKKKPQKILGLMGMSREETPATGPQHQETLGALERPEHGHSDAFRGPLQEERGLHRQLKGILTGAIQGSLTRDQALLAARKAIDQNQMAILEIARKRAARVMHKDVIELPPELVSRYESLRVDALKGFQTILDDSASQISLKMTSPIASVAGGKRRQLQVLKGLVPQHDLYVEPFAGGGRPILRPRQSRPRSLERCERTLHKLLELDQEGRPPRTSGSREQRLARRSKASNIHARQIQTKNPHRSSLQAPVRCKDQLHERSAEGISRKRSNAH
jgi:hypothetical protein